MAGNPGARAALKTTREELEAAQNQLRKYEQDKTPKRTRLAPKVFNDQTRADLILDLMDKAEDGQSITEVAASWGRTEEEVKDWAKNDVEFSRALGVASTRARAKATGDVRKAMNAGRNLSGTLLDRVMSMYAVTHGEDGADAARLVRINVSSDRKAEALARQRAEKKEESEPPTPRE